MFTAQGRGARGDGVVGGADQGEGQSLLAPARQLRPPPSTQPLPSASEQGGAAGDLSGVAPLRRKRLWQQAHVHAHPARKQVRETGDRPFTRGRLTFISLTWLFTVFLLRGRPAPAGARGSPSRFATSSRPQNSWRWAGGSGRQHTLLMEIQLTKVFSSACVCGVFG